MAAIITVPQSMAPIVFALAMSARGDLNLGALMIVVMTSAQVLGAVPIALRVCVFR